MGWTRHSGAVVSVALLASVAGHFAVQRHFESRQRSFEAVAPGTPYLTELPHAALQFMPPSLLPPGGLLATEEKESSAVPRYLSEFDRPARVSQVVPALQVRGDDESDNGSSKRRSPSDESLRQAPPRTVLAPHDATALTDGASPQDLVPVEEPLIPGPSPRRAEARGEIADRNSDLPSLPESQEVSDEHVPVGVDANAVRRVIEEELAGSSREERDIWYDELKSIPAGVVRDLLQVRKQLRSLPRALHKADAPVAAPVRVVQVPLPHVSVEAVSQSHRRPFLDWTPTMSAVEQAMTLARHNVANSVTPGFQRVRWQLVDAYGIDWSTSADGEAEEVNELASNQDSIPVEGCRLAAPLLDIKPGKLLKTGRSLDLAIDGGGFFQVMANGKPAFTRCGSLVLNSRRRMCLSVAGESAELQPPITIPAETQEIQVSARGEVFVLEAAGANAQTLGQLQLARFACPERLRPIGATLLSATNGSGEPDLGTPESSGRGALQQGCLEQSNVEVEAELADLERLQALLKSLPIPTRPVTASGAAAESH